MASTTRPKSMSVQVMYQYSTKEAGNIGIEGYHCPKLYTDIAKQVKDKHYAECRKKNKFPKSTIRPLKKGHYLEDHLRDKKFVPDPAKYNKLPQWVSQDDINKGKKLPKDTSKNSYIDQIIHDSKRTKFPGVGKYNVVKTSEQVKKDLEDLKAKHKQRLQQEKSQTQGHRFTMTESIQYIAAQIPGSGQYNPHNPNKEKLKMKVNTTKPDDWRKKHDNERRNQRAKTAHQIPGPGKYKEDHPVNYETFGKMLAKSKDKNRTKRDYFGKEERFKDPKKTKSIVNKILPAPNVYDMRQQWIGKDEGRKGNMKQNTNWMNRVTRGISKSIYY